MLSDAHGGHGFRTCDVEGERVLEFVNGLHVGNTYFKERELHLVTFRSGGHVKIIYAGEEGVELVRQLAEGVFSWGEIPTDWEKSFILNVYKVPWQLS